MVLQNIFLGRNRDTLILRSSGGGVLHMELIFSWLFNETHSIEEE
jgi:hypothetical protein